jgi:hypothetical protein
MVKTDRKVEQRGAGVSPRHRSTTRERSDLNLEGEARDRSIYGAFDLGLDFDFGL